MFYFKKIGESLPIGVESLWLKLEFECKLGLRVVAMTPEGVSRLNDVSMTFTQIIDTTEGDLDDFADGPGTESFDDIWVSLTAKTTKPSCCFPQAKLWVWQ